VVHESVHAAGEEVRRRVRTAAGLPLRSARLGVAGVTDVVAMHRNDTGRWRSYPVEHKRGRPKAHRADEVQLCVQAMALEEMFGTEIPEGVLFYGEPHRRTVVAFDTELRARPGDSRRGAALVAAGATPCMTGMRRLLNTLYSPRKVLMSTRMGRT
jgi:CRISPR-associated exonuclease Cas4